jgi:hypothetical protein
MKNMQNAASIVNKHLTTLMSQAVEISSINSKIEALLPDFLAKQCTVASFEGDTVTIHANNGGAGTMLRYHLGEILSGLQKESKFHTIKRVICHVRPSEKPTIGYEKGLGKPYHSDKGALLLEKSAAHIQDSAIQAALLRLANNVRNK